jgi:hypothetical protein
MGREPKVNPPHPKVSIYQRIYQLSARWGSFHYMTRILTAWRRAEASRSIRRLRDAGLIRTIQLTTKSGG